ncbi:hypothetical protein [Candidatus Allofournierella excrementavium]|uniref:hypothetical protein n=1 Tax=Candidatus Allofournierella excrementavium TaxID=2838591 RepID=UPI003AF579AD
MRAVKSLQKVFDAWVKRPDALRPGPPPLLFAVECGIIPDVQVLRGCAPGQSAVLRGFADARGFEQIFLTGGKDAVDGLGGAHRQFLSRF